MSHTRLFSFIAIVSFLAVSPVSGADVCFRDLLQSYSLNGLDNAQEIQLSMCPSVAKSCCQQVDQEAIYSNWIHGGEEEAVNDRYNQNAKVYEALVDKLIKVQEFARVSKKAVVKRIANCKLLADRILNFEVKEIQSQIKKNLNKMRDFFKDTYKGFYCTICNYENHKYFNKEQKIITFSEKFCRDIVESSLGPMLVFHVDMMKYLNLVSKFVTSCDTRGEYNLEAEFPKNLTFFEVSETKDMLESCRENRNKRDWFAYCKDVCMNFEVYSFATFFEPNIAQITEYNGFLQEALTTMANFQVTHALLNKDEAAKPKGRVLETTDEPKKKPIYKPGLGPKVNLMDWNIDFAVSGISLRDEGRNSLITDTMYNSIKTFLQLGRENSNVNQASILSSSDQQILNSVVPRSLFGKSSSIIQVVFCLLASLVMLG